MLQLPDLGRPRRARAPGGKEDEESKSKDDIDKSRVDNSSSDPYAYGGPRQRACLGCTGRPSAMRAATPIRQLRSGCVQLLFVSSSSRALA